MSEIWTPDDVTMTFRIAGWKAIIDKLALSGNGRLAEEINEALGKGAFEDPTSIAIPFGDSLLIMDAARSVATPDEPRRRQWWKP